jgi:hypothetical protein
VTFVLGYPLYQVRKVCDLCVRISTIPSEESVWLCLCVRISTIPSEESVSLSSLGIVDILTQRHDHTLSSLGIVDILTQRSHIFLTWYSGYPNTKVTHFPHLVSEESV